MGGPRYYFNGFGHHVTECQMGHYRMDPAWIDTDNRIWSEPYHLYGSVDLPHPTHEAKSHE